MLTYLIVTYLTALLVHKAPVPTYPAPVISPKMLERVKKETVLISVEGWGGVGRGTGVLIDSKHVLTCAHMIEDGVTLIYTYPMKRVITARPVLGDKAHDLAIFELDEPVELAHYAVFNSSTSIGQPIVVIGNTLGCMKWFVSYGIISEKDFFFLLTTALIKGGNSGGPWVNLNGQIVAITDWGLQHNGKSDNISGGVNAEAIQHFIDVFRHPSILSFSWGN